jgi:HAD superfamily hydrolase (TIGR01549 family)
MIEFVLVDCDGTLHDNRQRLRLQGEAVASTLGLSTEEAIRRYFQAHDRIHRSFPGRHDDTAFHFRLMMEDLHVSSPPAQELARVWQDAYDSYQDQPVPFSDAPPFLEELQRQGKHLALTSGSTESERRRFLRRLDMERYFEKVYAANSVGAQKRDPQFYAHVLADLGVRGDWVAAIGDSLRDDVSAKRFGIFTVLLRRDRSPEPAPGDYEPDGVVSTLTAALPLLLSHART